MTGKKAVKLAKCFSSGVIEVDEEEGEHSVICPDRSVLIYECGSTRDD